MQPAQAGTLESNDVLIMLSPGLPGSGTIIEIESVVIRQYGEAIRQVIAETLLTCQVSDVFVKVADRGALDCTIKARLLIALARSGII